MSVIDAGAATGAARGTAPGPVQFIGADKDYWRILVRGAGLLIVTLGLYRFWLATDIRRFLWAHTAIEDESLEYSGTAIELLQGFLVAIALLLPIYTVFLLAALDAGVLGSLLSLSAVLLLAFLSQYGIYLARRYRLTRTVFRGLRFHQAGSAARYSICAVWWWSLTVLSLGFAYPFARAALERFKMRNTYYGDVQSDFVGSGSGLFIRGFVMWLAVLIPVVMALSALGSIDWPAATGAIRSGGDVLGRMERASPGFLAAVGFAVVMLGLAFVLIALLLPAFHAMVMRWWVSGLRFGKIAAVSHLRTRDVYFAYLRFAGYLSLLAILIVFIIFVGLLIVGAMFGSGESQVSEVITVLIMVGTYVVAALGLSTLYQAVVAFSVWRLTANSIELSDTHQIAYVQAAGESSSPLGEGIADVLNLGGI